MNHGGGAYGLGAEYQGWTYTQQYEPEHRREGLVCIQQTMIPLITEEKTF